MALPVFPALHFHIIVLFPFQTLVDPLYHPTPNTGVHVFIPYHSYLLHYPNLFQIPITMTVRTTYSLTMYGDVVEEESKKTEVSKAEDQHKDTTCTAPLGTLYLCPVVCVLLDPWPCLLPMLLIRSSIKREKFL